VDPARSFEPQREQSPWHRQEASISRWWIALGGKLELEEDAGLARREMLASRFLSGSSETWRPAELAK
jgi:hypothetical protein